VDEGELCFDFSFGYAFRMHATNNMIYRPFSLTVRSSNFSTIQMHRVFISTSKAIEIPRDDSPSVGVASVSERNRVSI
jgi:hypothetical protein